MQGVKIRLVALAIASAAGTAGFAAPSAVEPGPLAQLVQVAFSHGFGGPLSGRLCTALGITRDNQSFPVEQLSSSAGGDNRSFNVSRHRGRLDVIIALKTKDSTLVFLTSANGELQKAVLEKPKEPMREIPVSDATAAFEKEKAWWLDIWMKAHFTDSGRK